jgi:hypothetical protein
MSDTARAFCLLVLLAVAPILLPQASPAATLRVDWAGGGDYTSIQPAMTDASDGDTILIAPGTYRGEENRVLVFGSHKNLVVESEQGLPTVTIDCEGADRAFYMYYTRQDTTSVIRGLVIENAYTDDYNGGGILTYKSDVVIEDCLFENCVASHNAGAVYISYTDVEDSGQGCRVRNCVFHGNTATYRGGALEVDHASAFIRDCLFYDNSTTVNAHVSEGGGAIVLNSVDDDSRYRCEISGCTLVRNSSPGHGTGILFWNSQTWTFFGNSIVAFNEGDSLAVYSHPALDGFTFSDVYGNEGGNVGPGYTTVLEEDPLFCGMAEDDFTLCADSPALPAGNVWNAAMGFADQGCGNCGSAIRSTSWGSIKALYR